MKLLFLTSQVLPIRSCATARTRIRVSGHMDIKDDETFGSDERVWRDKTFPAVYLDLTGSTRTELRWVERLGREIRVEVGFAFVLTSDRSITGNYNMKLFQSASESTNDLDSERTGRGWNCPAPNINGLKDIYSEQVTVSNDDEGGDWARFNVAIVFASFDSSFSPCGLNGRG